MNFGEIRKLGEILESSWQAQDYFNEYLILKEAIIQGHKEQDYYFRKNDKEKFMQNGEELFKKIDRLKFILNQLRINHGVNMEDLILLSVGVDV